MPKLHELREELRTLRKEHVKPVSRMPKSDVAEEINRLRLRREETPPVASTPGAGKRMSMAAVESIKEAKMHEFPVKPRCEEAAEPKMLKRTRKAKMEE